MDENASDGRGGKPGGWLADPASHPPRSAGQGTTRPPGVGVETGRITSDKRIFEQQGSLVTV